MPRLSVHGLQIIGGLTCVAATLIAWWVSWVQLARGRTHFISEVLALAWWQRDDDSSKRGSRGSLLASLLFGAGALAFMLAAGLELRAAWTAGATWSAVTGALLLAIVLVPMRLVAPARVLTAGGVELLHPFLAAVFYLVAMATAVAIAWPHAGPVGTVLAALHLLSSAVLSAAVLVLAPRALGPAAFQPWYLPGVRILLDRRPAEETPSEWVRRLQWPATLLVALDLGFTPTGI